MQAYWYTILTEKFVKCHRIFEGPRGYGDPQTYQSY